MVQKNYVQSLLKKFQDAHCFRRIFFQEYSFCYAKEITIMSYNNSNISFTFFVKN